MRHLFREEAERAALPDPMIDDLVIALSEAITNAVLHSRSPKIKVLWELSGDRAELTVEDSGVFSARIPTGFEEGPGGGRGIPIMMALVDEFSIREGNAKAPGTTVHLVKYQHAA